MSQKIPVLYSCNYCNYNTVIKKDFAKHIFTRKHQNRTNENNLEQENPEKSQQTNYLICDNCGKTYKARSGLWNHQKKCKSKKTINEEESLESEIDYKEMFLEMLKQNKELQNTIIEIMPKIGTTNNVITNTTNNNVVNNLTLLNNNCKDAISMTDFIDSIEIEMKHLIHTSKKGLVSGVANIFLENYNKLPIQMRPLWCSDKKRKKIYIKEEEWQEDKNNVKTKDAIKCLTAKQAKNTGMYIRENPDWMKHDKKKDDFINITKQTTSELDDNKQVNIINNLLENIHLSDEVKGELQNTS